MRRSNLFILLALGLILLLPPAAVWAEGNLGNMEVDMEDTAVRLARETARGGYDLVKTDELKAWMDEGRDMLIVDTMPYENSYLKHHIPGAVHFETPVGDPNMFDMTDQEAFLEMLGENKDRLIVFYCGYTHCGRSHYAAMWAIELGYTNVYRCPGGVIAWQERAYPVETGDPNP